MTAKARAIAAEIASSLKFRTTLAIAESFDSDGYPLVQVGTGDAGDPGGLIKVMPQDWSLAKDILGNTATIYTPHVAKIVFEANAEEGGADEDDVNTWAVLLPIIGEVVMRGTRVELYLSDNASAPDAAEIVADNLKATFDPMPTQGMIQNQ